MHEIRQFDDNRVPIMHATSANKPSVSFKRLAANQSLWFCADACLKLRPGGTGCEACRDACPVQAIRVEAGLVELAPACTGCGQCAAACPSGALLAEGFDALLQPLPEHEVVPRLRIECSRVPHQLAGNALQVPCLGGISSFALIGLVARNSSAVALIDRGWCATCPSGGGKEPIKMLVDAVRAVVTDIGLPDDRSPYVCPLPTSPVQALSLAATADSAPLPRRAFFGALLKRTAEAAVAVRSPDITRSALKTTRGALLASPLIRHTRRRMAASLVAVAGLAGKPLSAKFFPHITASEVCRLHGVCSAICPSGALAVKQSGTSVELHFDPELCLACGLCIHHCPTGALSMSPFGNAATPHAREGKQLNSCQQRDCRRCGKSYVNHDDEYLCPSCSSNRNMAESLFGTSFADNKSTAANLEL
ncbi:MAG: 4Fe-4S binding protein [Sulfuricella sp.]|nr:4Fe-4S binding protein [Sulfuricella sp.]